MVTYIKLLNSNPVSLRLAVAQLSWQLTRVIVAAGLHGLGGGLLLRAPVFKARYLFFQWPVIKSYFVSIRGYLGA